MNVLSIKHFKHLKEIKMFVRACGNMVALDFPLGLKRAGSLAASFLTPAPTKPSSRV